MRFPHYKQPESKDCGATCLKIIGKYFNKNLDLDYLRQLSETTRLGSSLLTLSNAAEAVGFHSLGVKIDLAQLQVAPLPCILHWNSNHYVVLYKIKTKKTLKERLSFKKTTATKTYYISDPAHGLLQYTETEFLKHWIGNNSTPKTKEGIVLLLEITSKFYSNTEPQYTKPRLGFSFLKNYLFKYKRFILQLIVGLIATSLLQLVFPFLTQSIVDIGIRNQDIHFVYLVFLAQLALFIGKTFLEIIRSWILLHLSTRINISLLADFFIKLMNLPISYFDSKITGDILQRIRDHKRIERLLTTTSLSIVFSLVNLLVFSLVLAYYNIQLFIVFAVGSLLYFLWIMLFLHKRRALDYARFSQISKEQSKIIELIGGMQDIKLYNAEKQKRWTLEFLQAKIFNISVKSLVLEQYQNMGSNFINHIKNMIISILAAKLVISGSITLGMMLAISYIVGQLNAPIIQLIAFIREVQDAKIALERLGEIHHKEDEIATNQYKQIQIDDNLPLVLKKVSFHYIGSDVAVLENLNLTIPAKKITAIVGTSGSGKTTLMKLLLKFYNPNTGNIQYGQQDLKNIAQQAWRQHCGVVLQEGFIFNDTIANNIAVGETTIDQARLIYAVKIANIYDYILRLPLTFNTKIGMEGVGLSTGQKQRLFIARAVYKNPKMLFFDEATSALDANNERIIMENLNQFFEDKTVVVIAHRLSTVRNADQIVVLEKGEIVEIGTHEELVKQKGNYFNLVKNQLELGS